MEKTISPEDRIRRAEEIYYRRRNNPNITRTATVNLNSKKEYKLIKKIIIQVLFCAGIFFLIYNIQANTDKLSTDSIKYIKHMLHYDMDLQYFINQSKNYVARAYNKEKKEEEDDKNETEENTINESEETPEVNEEIKEENSTEDISNISQMELDAKYIKEKISFIKPVQGEISSRFGLRNPTTETVPKYHTGIDIAVPEGTKFVCAMDGTVELVSSEGDYRKSCKNSKWRSCNNICTL